MQYFFVFNAAHGPTDASAWIDWVELWFIRFLENTKSADSNNLFLNKIEIAFRLHTLLFWSFAATQNVKC